MSLSKMDNKEMNGGQIYCKKFYRTYEISKHSQSDDCWIIIKKRVFNVSNLTKTMDEINDRTEILFQLLRVGGMDITDLFENRQKNRMEIFDLVSKSEYGKTNRLFWWNDPTYIIGGVTERERHIWVVNKSLDSRYQMTVCEEDSIYQIQEKFYKMFPDATNGHSIWRKTESVIDSGHLFLDKTLSENHLGWNPDDEITKLWILHRHDIHFCSYLNASRTSSLSQADSCSDLNISR